MGQGPSAGRDGSGSDGYRSQGRLSSVHAALDSLRFSQQDQAPVRKLLGSPKYPTAVLSVGQLERLIEYGLGGNGPGRDECSELLLYGRDVLRVVLAVLAPFHHLVNVLRSNGVERTNELINMDEIQDTRSFPIGRHIDSIE